MFTSKLVTMPTLVFSEAGKDAIFSVGLNCLIEFALILLITVVISRTPNTNFFELLKNKIGFFAYIVYIALAAFILVRIVYCFQEAYSFFLENLYDELNIFVFILPVLFISVFLASKGIRTIGRTLEITIWVILAGMVLALLSNTEFIDPTQNMPYFENGLKPILNGSVKSIFLFGSTLSLILLVGKVDSSQKLVKNTTLICGIGSIIMILACFVFYSVFGNSMQYVLFSLSEYSQFDPYILELQRLIWLTAVLDVAKLFCATLCLTFFLNQCLTEPFKIKSSLIPIVIASLIIVVLGVVTHFDTIIWFDITKSYLTYFTLGLMALIVFICVLLIRRKNE